MSACMLESEIDNELLLSLHLLNHIFECSANDRVECVKRFDNTVNQLNWAFNGLVPLVSRGVTFTSGCENAISILRQAINLLEYPSIGSTTSFPLIVIAVLPYCLIHFDSPTEIGNEAARNIANYCVKMLPDLSNSSNTPPSDHPLHNLATMMNQFQEHSFTRDKFMWAKCVVTYLIDAFSPNILDLIVFVCEILERSPPSMHIYLLHIIYLLILHGDLSNAFPSLLNTQVVRVVMKHIQTVNWKEAARIMKTILDQWNRISVNQMPESEELTSQRKPDFDLFIDKIETYSPQSPRKLVSTQQSTGGNADSLRRQANSTQARIRERLISLLPASGLPIGLPRSSSVIFSQSSSDVHYDGVLASNSNIQAVASNSAFSSSEGVSHQDELESASSLNIGNESATDSSFPRVFKEFDFLEAERDTISDAESCFNWLSTMRPLASVADDNADFEEQDNDDLNGPDDDDLNQNEDELDDEIDFTVGRGTMSFMSGQQRRRRRFSRPLSIDRTSDSANDISSDRTPIQSEKHSDDSLASCSSDDDEHDSSDVRASSSNKKFYPPVLPHLASPIESASTTSYPINEDLAMNVMETNSSIPCFSESSQTQRNQNERKYTLHLECNHHISGRVENAWLSRVHEIETDLDGLATSQCIIGFTQLLRESSVKLSTLLRDASHLLSPGNELTRNSFSNYFTQALNVVLRLSDCPFLFVTPHFLRSTNLLQSQKFTLYQLRQHFETFLERREQAIRSLNAIRSSLKLQNFGSQSSSLNIASQEVDLCTCFEKIFFQLLQMLEKLKDIVISVKRTPNSEDYNLSPAVSNLHRDLLACLSESPMPESRLSSSSLSIPINEQLSEILIVNLTNKQYKNAFLTLYQLRNLFGSEFGCCETLDIDVLLIQYCQSYKLKTWTLIGSVDILENGCQQLKDKSCMFSSLIRTLKSDAAATMRSSRMSSVNESLYNTTTHTS